MYADSLKVHNAVADLRTAYINIVNTRYATHIYVDDYGRHYV